MVSFDYIRNPNNIYQASFAAIEQQYPWHTIPEQIRPIAIRMAHAVGSVDFVQNLQWSGNLLTAGQQAIANEKKILVDSRMLAAGVAHHMLPNKKQLICTLDTTSRSEHLDNSIHNTRSMKAIEQSKNHLKDSIVVIGNAPTALFRLLEGIINENWHHPALIIGMPVGYIGAAESKQALAKHVPNDICYISITGKTGGSALAAGAINALIYNHRDAHAND